jgi:hypothetical protein
MVSEPQLAEFFASAVFPEAGVVDDEAAGVVVLELLGLVFEVVLPLLLLELLFVGDGLAPGAPPPIPGIAGIAGGAAAAAGAAVVGTVGLTTKQGLPVPPLMIVTPPGAAVPVVVVDAVETAEQGAYPK